MNRDFRHTLQLVIDCIRSPIYIEQNGKITLSNCFFKKQYKNSKVFQDIVQNQKCLIEKKDIGCNLFLCEIVNNGDFNLKDSFDKLNKALELL